MAIATATTSPQAQNYLVLAEQYFAARNFNGALESLLAIPPTLLPTNLNPGFQSLLGRTYLELKQPANAVEPLRAAVGGQKSNAGYRMMLATALHLSSQLEDAEKQYREVMRLDPTAENVPYNLASLLKERADFDGAIRAYRLALAKKPTFKNALAALADLLISRAEFTEAADLVNRALNADRNHPLAWHTAGKIAERTGNFEQSLDCFTKCTTYDPNMAEGWFNLARIQSRLNKTTEAISSFQRAHELAPYDEKYAFMYKQAAATDTNAQMPESYVRDLFDEYAHTFDKSLVEGLGYQTPARIAEQIAPWLATRSTTPPSLRVLDLGCGTGLMGPLLAPAAATLVGVDLSPKMLEKAKERGYTALHAAELVAFLQSSTAASYDLIVATDVFNYFGDLSAVFTESQRVLAPGGLFAFSVEAMTAAPDTPDDAPFRLGASSRFQHQEGYIRSLAAQSALHVQSATRAALRKESTHDVEGILFALTSA
jgi:predicted TPR repeat methyltransferase